MCSLGKAVGVCVVLFICCSTLAASTSVAGNENPPHEDSFHPREILVKLKQAPVSANKDALGMKSADADETDTVDQVLESISQKYGFKKGRTVFPRQASTMHMSSLSTEKRAKLEKGRETLERWCSFTVPEGTDIKDTVKLLKKDCLVEMAEPNYEWKMAWTFDPPVENLPDGTTDPLYPQQWYLAAAGVQQAWNYMNTNGVCGGGNSDVVIAVIDSGVDYNHEDLRANMWINTAEIPGNGIDDDNNGFVDDVHGCNVVSTSSNHSGDPMDMHGHGTHVSGIIAAQGYNDKGIIGVAFNTKVMAIRAAQYTGLLTIQDIAEGIIYATENGAEVINMSFGGYQHSYIVQDALELALNQAVLVAAAGNDSVGNPPTMYPAGLPYVIGVMANDSGGQRCWFSNYGYDIHAPGESIISTLPNDQYASWSGTSMATPIVSGIAALMRSYFWQRDIWSNRYIMGCIVGNGGGGVVNAHTALTSPPTPGVSMYENWVFDSKDIDEENNDGDGSVDAGETLHMAIELINRSGMAEDIDLTLRARHPGAMMDDPYVEILDGTSHIESMGPWVMYDNGLIYDEEGIIIGVEDPIVFRVDPNCANEHVIPFELTITFRDGWSEDSTEYTRISRWNYVVTRGKNVPRIISEDLTLTRDEFWIVNGPTLVETGATLTITEGTQVQFGAVSDDPYNPGPQNGYITVNGALIIEGTETDPVSLFPSYLVSGKYVSISANSRSHMRYAKVRNPKVSGFGYIDHCYFDQDADTPSISANQIGHTMFNRLRPAGTLESYHYENNCFNSGWTYPGQIYQEQYNRIARYKDCVFLQDNENNKVMSIGPTGFAPFVTYGNFSSCYYDQTNDVSYAGFTADSPYFGKYSGYTTTLAYFDQLETIANYFGGHVVSIHSQEEQNLIRSVFGEIVYIGLKPTGIPYRWQWYDGTELDYENFPTGGFEDNSPSLWDLTVFSRTSGGSSYWTQSDHSDHSIMEFDGEWQLSDFTAERGTQEFTDYLTDNTPGWYINCAFLNRFYPPSLSQWMRINTGVFGYPYIAPTQNNYWGTDSTELVDHMIYDFNDDFTKAKVVYGDLSSRGFESTYPHVDGVFVNGEDAITVPEVGAGPVTFTVTYNRDMNTDPNFAPLVTFGPSGPYTDYTIKPIGDGWLDARTWEGTFWVVPITGDGYQYLRIEGGQAADDGWLVAGMDAARYRFEIKTMGVQAMTLHATGSEARIDLAWQQDDFDLLAGYNLYRSTASDGTYQKINDTIIPVGHESFTDYDVTPAVPLYYKFTVLQTDYTESDFSNVASATPLDTVLPELAHMPVYQAVGGSNLRLTATATDNVSIESVTLYYRLVGETEYQSLAMINSSGDQWTVSIPGSAVLAPGIEYYISATDGISTVYSGTPALPHSVAVGNEPVLNFVTPNEGPIAGGTLVTLSGNMFQDGAEAYFGQIQATDVEFLSQSQIRCVTPPHYPALVDVKVVNPDLTECLLTNCFTYRDDNIVLTLPEVVADYGTMVDVPLVVSDLQGLLAASITINYDPSVIRVNQVSKGSLIPVGWSFVVNTNTAGTIIVSTAGAAEIGGTGDLVDIQFEITANPPASSALTISNSVLNDGAIAHMTDNGLLTVNGLFDIAGAVRYFSDAGPVPDAAVTLSGNSTPSVSNTGNDGSFTLTDIPVGSYRITPSKTNDISEITAYDAALVLQADASLITLSAMQILAADTNKNGLVSAMDASYILQKAVDSIALPFPGSQDIWLFTPAEREYALLNSDHTGQDFTAVLIGDVSGNWSASQQMQMMGLTQNASIFDATVSLPDIAFCDGQTMDVPVELTCEPGAEIVSADIEIEFNSQVLTLESLTAGDVLGLNNMAFDYNVGTPGVVKLAIAGTNPIAYDGTLVILRFASDTLQCTPEALVLTKASLNEGNVQAQAVNGTIRASSYEADFSCDCLVDIDDLLVIASQWLAVPGTPSADIAPTPADGEVNMLDFEEFAQQWLIGFE